MTQNQEAHTDTANNIKITKVINNLKHTTKRLNNENQIKITRNKKGKTVDIKHIETTNEIQGGKGNSIKISQKDKAKLDKL